MTANYPYRGRFAPSPTGPLHFGSLVAALGSYLDARHQNGTWLVRMEDLDTPRCIADAADDILRTLEIYGLHWDESVIYQSQRTDAYEDALNTLTLAGATYPCACTRKEIADSAMHGIEGPVYPGTCRNGLPAGKVARAWRVRSGMNGLSVPIIFDDKLKKHIQQNLEEEIGDFVIKRADGLFAYQLAVTVDDAYQKITHIVRGADLLTSTPRQIYLQQLLGLPHPQYMHLPIATNAQGEKLSKQTQAQALDQNNPAIQLVSALSFLKQNPPADLYGNSVEDILRWATANWSENNII